MWALRRIDTPFWEPSAFFFRHKHMIELLFRIKRIGAAWMFAGTISLWSLWTSYKRSEGSNTVSPKGAVYKIPVPPSGKQP